MKLVSLLFVLVGVSTQSALALPLLSEKNINLSLASPLFTADYNFEGIVALSNCSGSLIRLENSKETDKAMVLTNGHCLEFGMPEPGEVIVNRNSNRAFRLLNRNAQGIGTVTARKVMYSTMTKTDMTIYQLNETFAQIKSATGLDPLTLSSAPPQIGERIEVISGYWKRGYSCGVEAVVPQLLEGDWLCEQSIRYTRPGCEVIGGTSGSPVIRANSRTVVGVNNTGNEDGYLCSVNNPCEISPDGRKTAVQGYSYAQQTYWFYTCLNANNEIDMSRVGCLLPK